MVWQLLATFRLQLHLENPLVVPTANVHVYWGIFLFQYLSKIGLRWRARWLSRILEVTGLEVRGLEVTGNTVPEHVTWALQAVSFKQ